MEDNLKKNGRRPQKKIKKWKTTSKNKLKNGRRPQKKWKMNQSTKINLIGCDTIVNSTSLRFLCIESTRKFPWSKHPFFIVFFCQR